MEISKTLEQTLKSGCQKQDFRSFLRIKLDKNQTLDLDKKKKFEQWLDFVLICETIFKLPNSKTREKHLLMVQIGDEFFGNGSRSHKIAVTDQINRRSLQHYKSILELESFLDSLKKCYDYIYCKLEQKHDIFIKLYLSYNYNQFFMSLARKFKL